MGMFSEVIVPPALLPEEYRELKNWQTKDVVDPFMETLEITNEGELIHTWWEREFVNDPNHWGGLSYKVKAEHKDVLDYHGDMVFYAFDKPQDQELVRLRARFTSGKLESIIKL